MWVPYQQCHPSRTSLSCLDSYTTVRLYQRRSGINSDVRGFRPPRHYLSLRSRLPYMISLRSSDRAESNRPNVRRMQVLITTRIWSRFQPPKCTAHASAQHDADLESIPTARHSAISPPSRGAPSPRSLIRISHQPSFSGGSIAELVAELEVERGRLHGSRRDCMHDCMHVWTSCIPAHASHTSVAWSLIRKSSAARLSSASC